MFVFEERESKVDNIELIRTITIIIYYVSFVFYLPMLFLIFKGFIKKCFSQIRIINLFIIIASILQGFSFLFGYHNTQESLCIMKGPLNLSFLLCLLFSATAYVFVSFRQMWKTNDKQSKLKFFVFIFLWCVFCPSLIYFWYVFFINYYHDYNHPCWISKPISYIILFSLYFLGLFIAIIFLFKSMSNLNKFMNANPDSKDLSLKFKRRLLHYIFVMFLNFCIFILKLVMFLIEHRGYVIRNFWANLIRYLLDITNGPIFVIIYCYDETSIKELKSLCSSKKAKPNSSLENEIGDINIVDDDEELNRSIL